ncbi:Chorismate synthase [Caloramator mitchellensis]|uniref:Chorismate synthase n=1 Tax=Caloramator mitchellensis TaxID=908809 RepID=A0A0R3JX51_CALMK|nr:chorismate synthase [Caloramator mitchellensis]KRQ88123.1 Chorismate synthase [Caloramator mitchellensis]
MLRFLDAGESHGKMLVAILEGFPSNVPIDIENINKQLQRRQIGFGRGTRMKIESDRIEIISGVRGGKTTGAPICISIKNKDYENWAEVMDFQKEYNEKITIPRPGHADLNGFLKYNLDDIRNVIERASARETAIRVAIGAICMELLKFFDVKFISRVVMIGNIEDFSYIDSYNEDLINKIESSPIRCLHKDIEKKMIKEIQIAKEIGETIGGAIEVIAFGVPVGLGSYSFYDRRMDYLISGAMMSIQGVKAVEIGNGIKSSKLYGSEFNDKIIFEDGRFSRKTNNLGGIEGGITNGMPIKVRLFMKPIPTTRREFETFDVHGNVVKSRYERSDVCAVPALAVIAENVLAYEVAKEMINKFAGDSLEDLLISFEHYINRVNRGEDYGRDNFSPAMQGQ